MQSNVYETNIDALIKAAEILEERQTTKGTRGIQDIAPSVVLEESPITESFKNEVHKSIFNRDARKTHNQLEKSRRANIKCRFNCLKELVPNTRGKKCSSLSILRGAVRTVQMLSQRQNELELLEKQLLLEGENLIKKREMKRQELVALEIDPDEIIASATDKNSKSNKSCDSKHSQSLDNDSRLSSDRERKRHADNQHFDENESTTTASECGDDCDIDEMTDDASECGEISHKFDNGPDELDNGPVHKLMLLNRDEIAVSLSSSGHSFSSVSDIASSLNNSTCSSQSLDSSQRVLPVKKRRLDWTNFSQSPTDIDCSSTVRNCAVSTCDMTTPPLVKELPSALTSKIQSPSSFPSTLSSSRLIVSSDHPTVNNRSCHSAKLLEQERTRSQSDLLYQTLTCNYMKSVQPPSASEKTLSWHPGSDLSTVSTNRMPVLERTLTETELGKSLNLPSRNQILTSPPPRRAGTPGPSFDRSTSLEAQPEGLSPFWIGQKMQPVYNLLGGKSISLQNEFTEFSSSSFDSHNYNTSGLTSFKPSRSSLITSSVTSGSAIKSGSMHNQNSSLITNLSPREMINDQESLRLPTAHRSLEPHISSLYSQKPIMNTFLPNSSLRESSSSDHQIKKPFQFSVIPRNTLNSSETGSRLLPVDSPVLLLPVQLTTSVNQNTAVSNRCLDTLIPAVQTQQNGRLSVNDPS